MPSSNDVTVTGSMITAMSYIPGSLVITKDESSSPPPTFKQSGSTWTINIGADRKNSTDVATSFNNKTGGLGHEYAPNSGEGGTPNQLNFFFGVDITLQTGAGAVQVPVYFGQGHFSLTNNWWIGGNTVINQGKPVLLAISGNVVQQVLALSGGTSSFNFTPI